MGTSLMLLHVELCIKVFITLATGYPLSLKNKIITNYCIASIFTSLLHYSLSSRAVSHLSTILFFLLNTSCPLFSFFFAQVRAVLLYNYQKFLQFGVRDTLTLIDIFHPDRTRHLKASFHLFALKHYNQIQHQCKIHVEDLPPFL